LTAPLSIAVGPGFEKTQSIGDLPPIPDFCVSPPRMAPSWRIMAVIKGISWSLMLPLVYTYTRSYSNPKIGLDAANTLPGLPQIPADFDFFQLGSNCGYYLPLAIKQP